MTARSRSRGARTAATTPRGPGLALNVGNSRVAIGVFGADGHLVATFRLSSKVDRTEDELETAVAGFLAPFGDLLPGGWCGIASVVPARTQAFVSLAAGWTRGDPVQVSGTDVPGLRMDVPDPGSVGADRVANAVAAAARGVLPCIVVDLGTATHFEVIAPGPRFLGGLIAPGVALGAEALFAGAARLAAVELARPPRVIGRTTQECLQTGLYLGALAQLEGLVRQVRAELGVPAPVLVTGGLAPLLAPGSRLLRHVVPELTLEGIALLASRPR